jgi:hypothetical protein
MFVRGIVVGDPMDLAVPGSRFADQIQKLQPETSTIPGADAAAGSG